MANINNAYSGNLNGWPIFSLLEPDFAKTIRMAFVFGNLGNEALIVTKDKMVYGVGSNNSGCLGTGDSSSTFHPKLVEVLCGMNIKSFVSHGANPCVLALTEEGQVYSWGYKGLFNTSERTTEVRVQPVYRDSLPIVDIPTPTHVSAFEDSTVIQIACGYSHFLALTHLGEVCAWGDNSFQQCAGSVDEKHVQLPRKVNYGINFEPAISIACGHSFSMMVTKTGKVYSWGSNDYGQLGTNQGNTQNVQIPVLIHALCGTRIVKVVCGLSHAMALSSQGTLYTWGDDKYQELGSKISPYRKTPYLVTMKEMGKVSDIAAIHSSCISVAMAETGTVFIWGQCRGQIVHEPTRTRFGHMNEAFSSFAIPSVMYEPLILYEKVESSVAFSMKQAFNDPTTADLTIKVGENPIYVHKAILKIRSVYFRTMFQDHFTENTESVLEHDEYSYDVYKAFLEYLYTDEINLHSDDVLELLRLADAFCEPALKTCCGRLMRSMITVENALPFYATVTEYNMKELEEFCFNFAISHMTAVMLTESFKKLDKHKITDFVRAAAQAGAFNT